MDLLKNTALYIASKTIKGIRRMNLTIILYVQRLEKIQYDDDNEMCKQTNSTLKP